MSHLIVSEEEGCLTLGLNRGSAHNALNDDLIKSLVDEIHNAEKNKKIKLVVLRSIGKNFCAGGDIKDMKSRSGMFAGNSMDLYHQYKKGIQQIPLAIESLNKPIICLIQGAAIGAGLDLACMCDIRIASSQASFSESFSKLGLISGDGGAFFLQRVVGYSKAMEMSLTGRKYSADEALDMGLINELDDDLDQVLSKYKKNILSQSSSALQMSKRLLKQAYRSHVEESLDQAASFQGILQRSSDHLKFIEK